MENPNDFKYNKDMNLLEIIATKRSGHHAMLNWLIKNLFDVQINHWYKLTFLSGKNAWHWNDTSKKIEEGERLFREAISKNEIPNFLLVNYEDTPSNYCFFSNDKKYKGKLTQYKFDDINITLKNRVIFIRDFYDTIHSRYLGVKNGVVIDGYYDKNFINLWKNHAIYSLKNPTNVLKFEDWKEKKDKRDKFLINNFGIHEMFDSSNIIGTKTSNIKSEIKDYSIIPEEIKELIRKDNELHYLIGAMGYDYKKI